jgi:hypothetical protein
MYHQLMYLQLMYQQLMYLQLMYLQLMYLQLMYLQLMYLRLMYLRLMHLRLMYLRLMYLRLMYLQLMYLLSHIYKNIPVSFDFIITSNQGVFLCSPCIIGVGNEKSRFSVWKYLLLIILFLYIFVPSVKPQN